MPTQVLYTGGSVRLVVNPRSIASTQVVSGYLLVIYSDGAVENAGHVGGSVTEPATIYNTTGASPLSGQSVDGFTAMANTIDARLTALGV